MLLSLFSGWFWHPLTNGPGYNFWSGIAGSFVSSWLPNPSVLLVGFLWLRHHNCHVDGCKSVRTSIDPLVHAPACRRHHSLRHLHGKDPHE